ncbi:MAG: hypothetical protein ACE5J9_02530 [Methanosarcinales archaeon]
MNEQITQTAMNGEGYMPSFQVFWHSWHSWDLCNCADFSRLARSSGRRNSTCL